MSLNIEKNSMGPHMQIRKWKRDQKRIRQDLFDNKPIIPVHIGIQEDWYLELKEYIKRTRKFKSFSEYIRYLILQDQC